VFNVSSISQAEGGVEAAAPTEESADHLLLDCEHEEVRVARIECQIPEHFHCGYNNKRNLAALHLAPDAWPQIHQFFKELGISP